MIRSHRDFRRLWSAAALSQLGSQVSALAIPLTALTVLHASTFQIGLLTALQGAAFLLIGLPAGAWVDRLRRRGVMVAADLARAALLLSIPLAAWTGALTLGQLYLVELGTGLCTVFFDVAYQPYLSFLVGRDRLVEGNGRLEASRSASYFAGPSIAGWLVQVLTAPVAVLVDAASFCWSAGWLAAIRAREPLRTRQSHRTRLRHDIAEGLRLVLGHPVLRAFALFNAASVLFLSMEHALDIVFLARTLGIPPTGIGLLYAVASLGAVLGALAAPPISRRAGQVRTILAAAGIGNTALLLIPLSRPGPLLACFVLGSGISSFCIVTNNIVAVAYRQSLCPDRLLGRMNATSRFLSWGLIPVGALLGGALGTVLGVRTALWVATAGFATATLVLLAARRHLRAATPIDPDRATTVPAAVS